MSCRKWIWLGLWVLSVVGISFYGGAVSYGLFFSLTLLPVISLIYLLCVYMRFKIYQEVESRDMVCDQPMPYYFVLCNEDYFGFASVKVRMFPRFSYVEDMAEDREYELLPGDKVVYHTRLICKYRGEYPVGLKEVIVTDFFQIFQLRYPVPGTIKAIIKPRLVEVEALRTMPEVTEMLHRESYLAQNQPDVVVKNYVSGDELRLVNWKITARMQQLKVRKTIGEERQGICVFLDTARHYKRIEEYLPTESKMLETLLALGIFFAKKDMSVSVYYKQQVLQQANINNIRNFEHFYGRMSEIAFDGEENATLLLQELLDGGCVSHHKVIIGIVQKLNVELLQLMEKITLNECAVLLYVISDENQDAFLEQSSLRKKIVVIPVEAELEGVL